MSSKTELKPAKSVKLKSYQPNYKPNARQLGRVVSLIKKAKRPLILAGGGVILSKGADELRKFAEAIQSPVTTTLMGLGAFPRIPPNGWE
jgi:acetolactate synthase-1/2/3 large subunit